MGEEERQEPAARITVHPAIFLLLNLPFGLTTGYIIAVLPLQLTSAGVPIAETAAIVAFAMSPKVWKFIWAPVADLTLTLKAWYVIGAAMAAVMLAITSLVPVSREFVWLIAVCLFLAEVGTSFLTIALAGLIASAVPDDKKGRASGWYQLGGKLAKGLAAGAGVWLAVHARWAFIPGMSAGAICALSIFGIALLRPAVHRQSAPFASRLKQYRQDFASLWKNSASRFVLFIAVVPIGIAGVSNFWSGVGTEWRASPDLVALMTGPMEAVAAIIGCLLAGWLADRTDRRFVFLGCGAALAAVELILSAAPTVPLSFIAGTFSVSLLLAMADAALTALVLSVIGTRGAATKYAVLAGLGNIPDIYMTSLSGLAHDEWGLRAMLQLEGTLALACITIALIFVIAKSRIDHSPVRPGGSLSPP